MNLIAALRKVIRHDVSEAYEDQGYIKDHQVWIYRDANDEVVHVDKDWRCCKGILMGTIKKVPIKDVIKPDDQGKV